MLRRPPPRVQDKIIGDDELTKPGGMIGDVDDMQNFVHSNKGDPKDLWISGFGWIIKNGKATENAEPFMKDLLRRSKKKDKK